MMRTLVAIGMLSLGMVLTGCAPGPGASDVPDKDLILRTHFAGVTDLLRTPDTATLNQIAGASNSAPFRAEVQQKLAALFASWFLAGDRAKASNNAGLFEPLVRDLIDAESCLEWRGPEVGAGQTFLAVRLSEARSAAWQTNLWRLLQVRNGKAPIPSSLEGVAGWESAPVSGGQPWRVTATKDWLVLSCEPQPMALHAAALKRIKTGGGPAAPLAGHWLRADLNLHRLKPYVPLLSVPDQLPVAHVVVSNRTDNVRMRAQLVFAKPLDLKLDPWQIPTNTIRDPLVSFSAVRGIGSWLGKWGPVASSKVDPLPGQLFSWAIDRTPFLTMWAAASPVATNLFEQLERGLPAYFNERPDLRYLGGWVSLTNFTRIQWRGLPFVVPYVLPMREESGGFLVAGLFPVAPPTNAPPPELFAEVLARKDLIYYGWEITQARLGQLDQMDRRIIPLVMPRVKPDPNSLAKKWLADISPLLGNTGTQAALAGPAEVEVIRRSPLGLTALELMLLTRWLEMPDFPALPEKWNSPAPPQVDKLPASPR